MDKKNKVVKIEFERKLIPQTKKVNSFDDLIFKYRKSFLDDDNLEFQAYYVFDNNYAISVITGISKNNDNIFYSSFMHTFEVAILFNGECIYDTGITDNVFGYQTPEQITKIIKQIEALPKRALPND